MIGKHTAAAELVLLSGTATDVASSAVHASADSDIDLLQKCIAVIQAIRGYLMLSCRAIVSFLAKIRLQLIGIVLTLTDRGRTRPSKKCVSLIVLIKRWVCLQEDIAVMQKIDGRLILSCGAIVSPLGWSGNQKMGLDLAGIHMPVPHFNDGPALKYVSKIFERGLKAEVPLSRANWFIMHTGELSLVCAEVETVCMLCSDQVSCCAVPHLSVLCYATLRCCALCCAVLCYTTLCCAVPWCAVLCCAMVCRPVSGVVHLRADLAMYTDCVNFLQC